MKVKYQIEDFDGQHTRWIDVKRGEPNWRNDWRKDWRKDWLLYELSDGTVGLKRPGTWRIKP